MPIIRRYTCARRCLSKTVRIHLGHHFYGAGNLGDDFMLAGFLAAMRSIAPSAEFTCSVPFPLPPLQRRFSQVTWLPYEVGVREQAIDQCDAWLGLGGSPFQHTQSRWFVDHLLADARTCETRGKPMYFLGIGVQGTNELTHPDVHRIVANASAIWTRDRVSADRLRELQITSPVHAGADLAHVFFKTTPPPRAASGRFTAVLNFDFETWPGQAACLQAITEVTPQERVWLAQESRALAGAELALFEALDSAEHASWQLISPERPGAPLEDVLADWPSGEWLLTSRYHAALAGAWSGSKIVIITINEKLRAAAADLGVTTISSDADEDTVRRAFATASSPESPRSLADLAHKACAEFVEHC